MKIPNFILGLILPLAIATPSSSFAKLSDVKNDVENVSAWLNKMYIVSSTPVGTEGDTLKPEPLQQRSVRESFQRINTELLALKVLLDEEYHAAIKRDNNPIDPGLSFNYALTSDLQSKVQKTVDEFAELSDKLQRARMTQAQAKALYMEFFAKVYDRFDVISEKDGYIRQRFNLLAERYQ
jgi:hypothetical protein